MARWPEYFMVAESPSGTLMGYIMGKSEVRLLSEWQDCKFRVSGHK